MLPFLGITEIPKDEIEKARLLARCLQHQPCLLILDGLEPLQYSENLQSMNGELQDGALKEFIACFRQTAGKSFVLLSSRQPLVELKKWQAEHYLSLDLKTLPHEDGADLLKALDVAGNEAERQAISKDLNGHALSLVLMGHLLSEYHQGDPRYAKEAPPLILAHGDSDAEKDSRHAVRVLDYYDSLQDAASRCFLQLLGLFDRPMNAAEKAVLIAGANHAEPLRALTDLEWKKVEQRLEKSGLLLGKKGSFEHLEWDTHPIIRSFFGEKFKENYPKAFKQAHSILFEYYQRLPEKKLPNTLEEMLPLYQAVAHGCSAGEYEQALQIFYQRIRRENQNGKSYSLHTLGAYSEDLVVLVSFFSPNYKKHINALDKVWQAWLLQALSFCLMSLGRLHEAIEPRKLYLDLVTEPEKEKIERWDTVVSAYQNLADCYIPLGELAKAKILFQKMLKNTEQGNNYTNGYDSMRSHVYIATILHRCGNFNEAKKYFIYPRLCLLWGFVYYLFLLDTTKDEAVFKKIIERVEHCTEDDSYPEASLLTKSLDPLTIARAYVALNEFNKAENYFSQAILCIHKANKLHHTPPFYLYRADFYLAQNQLDAAQADLNSAWEIIERCGMKLYAADYLLIHGRYSLATSDFDTALDNYKEAKQLIKEIGYHLRDAELDLLAAQYGDIDGKSANDYLQKAKNRIEEIGQWGLMPRWEKLNCIINGS